MTIMPDPTQNVPVNSLLVLSRGEYSDYAYGLYRAAQEMDVEELMRVYLAERPEQAQQYRFREQEFVAWLLDAEVVVPASAFEWHFSAYSTASSGAGLTKFLGETSE